MEIYKHNRFIVLLLIQHLKGLYIVHMLARNSWSIYISIRLNRCNLARRQSTLEMYPHKSI